MNRDVLTRGRRPRSLPSDLVEERLTKAAELADQIGHEDRIAVNAMRFREGTFVRSDRSLVKYFQWVRRFPKANPGGRPPMTETAK